MTIRTACSSALVGLNEAVLAIQRGDCEGAVIGGANLIFAPAATAFMTEKGVLSPDGSCKTFSADANGYARGEAITAVFIKPLKAALRDGNPIRAVIRSVVSNSDGKTPGISHPSTESQEALIRKAYYTAGINDFSKTAFVECHGTGTSTGDPVETNAVARVFGDSGVLIGSVKPNLGHSEGASGLTSLIKGVLALENRIVPPNIKFSSPNPKIPFKERNLTVPVEPTPWPEFRSERVSINSFGVGGSNAHVILDSARSFAIPDHEPDDRLVGPQLILLSASSAISLQKMTGSFQDWLPTQQDRLQSIAYTLANRREHLPHRTFMIASRSRIGTVSQGRKISSSSPNLVMVFTGQGAQWVRMGRDLLLQPDSRFRKTIKTLDKYLKTVSDGPSWTLEEELLKSAITSRVHAAELSQPLCTAVQIALVDSLVAAGVTPAAVVGHSSGEIAAAYAAGALTANEAIFVAWQRGVAVEQQTKQGAMAAVGLSWEETASFLKAPNVVVACENSPKSVTISGDAKEVQEAVTRIKEAHPTITCRLLKVDKAYHSHHMQDVGAGYSTLISRNLAAKAPKVPFYSSVSGKREKDINLDAKYWQRNLESPVLFRSAVTEILGSMENVAFLEVGPHPALAGPVRQILTAHAASGQATYISSLNRGENSVESFLTCIGKLYELNISINLHSLFPKGRCLPGLPRYSWDHEADYWRESRIAHAWRCRKYPSHPLLGVFQLESSSLEPSWRNILRIDDASWTRDHKIEDNVILPCAGFVSMVGEAIRQVTDFQDGYILRRVVLSSALVLNERTPVEVVTTFHPHRLTDSLDSQWWNFTISSYNGHIWAKHCTGQVAAATDEKSKDNKALVITKPLPRKLESKKYYDILNRAGLRFGPFFQRLKDIRTGTTQLLATAEVSHIKAGDEEDYHLHPSIIDACIQSAPLAALVGQIEPTHYRRVPTKIDRLVVHRCSGAKVQVSASATYIKSSGEVVGQVQQCMVDGNVVMQMEGLRLSFLEEAGDAKASGDFQTTARLTWGPHIDFLDASTLIKPSFPRHLYTPSLDVLARLCMVSADRNTAGVHTSLPHLEKYRDWMSLQVKDMNNTEKWSSITVLDDDSTGNKIHNLVQQLADTPVADCAVALEKVAKNIPALFSGETEALDVLMADGILTKLYNITDACDRTQFIRHLAHSKPNLRILEIGAGTGATTASMLKLLTLPGSSAPSLYSKYTFSDISSGFFVSAKDRFKDYPNIEYRILDISKDPSEQGFDTMKYDVIFATNVIHATKSLRESLQNVHKLLAPDGRFVLHELHSTSKWPNFIFGTLPGWWYGEPDERPNEPCVSPTRWELELRNAGFAGLDAVVLDGEEPHQLNAIMVARPQDNKVMDTNRKVSLLCEATDDDFGESLSRHLQARGYEVQKFNLGDELPQSQDIISLLDYRKPFFEDIEDTRFRLFQTLLANLGTSGMLWLTHLSQVRCADPRWAQIIGASRSIRTEMLVDFATCEVDNIDSSLDKIIDVYSKFQARKGDESFKPDYEYAIVEGIVHVGRIYPFSVEDELLVAAKPEDTISLGMDKAGRLSSMKLSIRKERLLVDDEVEVAIYAAGLNFKVRIFLVWRMKLANHILVNRMF
jgi:acyl transferase domain-containing protein/SAM-dependent methyltransferase